MTDVLNGLGIVLALALATAGALWVTPPQALPSQPPIAGSPTAPSPMSPTERIDARGRAVPIAAYRRVVSVNPVADHILLELLEPERLVAITAYTRDHHPDGWRFGERPVVQASDRIEALLALEPDLVVTSAYADEAFMARLREAGVQVFDLGTQRGLSTTRAGVVDLASLLAVPQRAAPILATLEAQVSELTRPEPTLRPGMYLTVYGASFFGGTRGSSQHDLLTLGGVRDVAAEAGFVDWPQYRLEQILALDPALLVTQEGGRSAICGNDALAGLTACGPSGQVIELPEAVASETGLHLPRAAATLKAQIEALPPR